jgi:hypothetical protein
LNGHKKENDHENEIEHEHTQPEWTWHRKGYAPYFYGASKKTRHKPRVTFGNMFLKLT